MRTVAIIQARMGSKRLPDKSMMSIRGIPLLQMVIERVKRATTVDEVILATSTNAENDQLCTLAESLGIKVYRGSEDDVLSRFVGAAKESGADIIVRICADNPLVDPGAIDDLVRFRDVNKTDYSFNHIPSAGNHYPDGLGAEVMTIGTLHLLDSKSTTAEEREHVTLRAVRTCGLEAPLDVMGPDIKLDIDTPEDYARMKGFIESLPEKNGPYWTAGEIVRSYREYFQTKAIFILEQKDDALEFIHAYYGDTVATPLVTSPAAWWEFEKRGISCIRIHDYFDVEEIYHLGMNNYRILERVCSVSDENIGKKIEEVHTYGLQPSRYSLYNTKLLLDNISIRANLLKKVIDRERPGLVYVIANHCTPTHDPDSFLDASINWFPFILEQMCQKHVVLRYDKTRVHEKAKSRKSSIRTALSDNTIAISARFSGVLNTISMIPKYILNRKKKTILLLGHSYNWNSIVPELVSRGYKVKRLLTSGPVSFDTRAEIPKDVVGELVIDGIDFSGPVRMYMLLRLALTLGYISMVASRIEKYVSSTAVLSGQRTRAEEHIFARIAQYHHIPVISWQHGAYGAHTTPTPLYTEFMGSDKVFLWGDGVKETMEKDPLNTFPCRIISVGSREVEDVAKKKWPQGGKILYVTTLYHRNKMYVSYGNPFHDNLLWETQRAVLDAIGSRKATFKIHPNETTSEHIEEYINSRGYNINIVKSEKSFMELLEDAKVVIIDFPHTSMLQAIAAGKPVIALTRHTKFTDEAIASLRKCAYCTEDLSEFTGAIHDYLDGKLSVGSDSHEFLMRYGIHESKSSEKAVSIVLNT